MNHAKQAEIFNRDESRTTWHDESLWFVRQKRDRAAHGIPEWEELRELASQIKTHTLSKLDYYLEELERNAQQNGVVVHWAEDAAALRSTVYGLLNQKGVRKIVKSKSMLTEECKLNPYLIERGIEVVDSDLGERIVQLADEEPSHIVMPAIHKKKEEIGEIFHQHMGTRKGASDPQYLTESARQNLRQHFLSADAALTGVNFAVAETGGFVVCTNEGNADLGVHLAPIHIACMGIEKVIPKLEHLGVFTRLLARSGTGQPITTYTSHFHKAREGAELHLILVDNGRTTQLGRPDFRKSLHCIRCGACMNTCPVYRRSGGHSYNYTVPGPIGSILSPGLDLKKHGSLPFASTLCGSCSDVCPVKIDIHQQLYKWRQIITREGKTDLSKKLSMKLMGLMMANPWWYKTMGKLGRSMLQVLPSSVIKNKWNPWTKQRELPEAPVKSFQEWYQDNKKNER